VNNLLLTLDFNVPKVVVVVVVGVVVVAQCS